MTAPAPAVQAYWYIPRLDRGEWVLFLVDTGASETTLNGIHALALQSHMRTRTLSPSFGIGGSCQYFGERAIIVFRDDRNQWLSRTIQRLGIQLIEQQHPSNSTVLYCPCLLGRDILNDCIFNYNPSHTDVTLMFR